MHGNGNDYLTHSDLHHIGFDHIGKNLRISRKCSFYEIKGIIGDNVRIDDFCILKGKIEIGSNVHIASFGLLSGAYDRITIGSFTSLAVRATVLTGSDDYGAVDDLPNSEYAHILKGPIVIGLGTLIGAHSVILPGVTIGDGVSVGAGSVIWKDVPSGSIVRPAPTSIKTHKKRDAERIKTFALRVFENVDGEV